MKKLLSLLAFIGVFALMPNQELKASHAAGGQITYDYIGDSTGIPFQYCVTLELIFDQAGVTPPGSANICYTSSCFPGGNVTFNATTVNSSQNIPIPTLDECVETTAPGYVIIFKRVYKGLVTLPGKCADWTFNYDLCCRNMAINNLMNPSSQDFYIEALLNNSGTIGENDSPQFLTPAAKAFCVVQPGQKPFVWSQVAIEPDGTDSLRYTFGQPQTANFGTPCPTPAFIPWGTFNGFSYSTQDPMATLNGITVDEANGTFTFSPSMPQVCVIKVNIEEYRFDSTSLQYLLIGQVSRDVQVPITGACKSSAADGPKIDISANAGTSLSILPSDTIKNYGFPSISNDSTFNTTTQSYDYEIPVIDYQCYDDLVAMEFDIDIQCSSIDENGLDFRIFGASDSVARPVTGVIDSCKPDLTTGKVHLELFKSLDVNQDYFLYVKRGNDGNTLTNRCGFELAPYYLIILRVNDCDTLKYDTENVTVVGDSAIQVDWSADTNTFREQDFGAWWVWRHRLDVVPPQAPELIKEVSDVNQRTYLDATLGDNVVDVSRFSYWVQFPRNFTAEPPTRPITSILLSDTLRADSSGYDLYWTAYDGWDSAAYEVFVGKFDSTVAVMDWQNYAGPEFDFFTMGYDFPSDEELPDSAGTYCFKVEATDSLDATNPYISESNWIYIILTYIEPEEPEIKDPRPVRVPNVFTPNGDGINDVFTVTAQNYTDATAQIYNRWGKLVYEETTSKPREATNVFLWPGVDQNSGSDLADGTYFYIVSLSDQVTGEKKELTGHVSIFRGTN